MLEAKRRSKHHFIKTAPVKRAGDGANGARESMVLSETGTPPPWSVSLLFHGLVCASWSVSLQGLVPDTALVT
jgi:hypothetical protein